MSSFTNETRKPAQGLSNSFEVTWEQAAQLGLRLKSVDSQAGAMNFYTVE